MCCVKHDQRWHWVTGEHERDTAILGDALSLSSASGCTFILHSPCNPRARATLIQPLTSHADRANHPNPILSPLAPGNTFHQQESPEVKLCYSYSPNK